MKKNILQTISGGYDSTFLLIKNLKEGHDVYPIFIHSSSVNQIKQVIELNAVKILIQKLQERFDNLYNLKEVEIKLDNIQGIISLQPIIWMLGLFNEVKNKQFYKNYDEVQIGYVLQDCAVSYLKEIRVFWKSLFSFSFLEYTVPKIKFPLVKYHKTTIINELEYYSYEIMQNCWFCEDPKIIKTKKLKNGNMELYIESCGDCHPCTRIKNINKFKSLKKYKLVLNINDFSNSIDKTVKKIIKEIRIHNIPHNFINVEEMDEKKIKLINEADKPIKKHSKQKKPPVN